MKLGVAVSTSDALPGAFVVFRGDLADLVDTCAALGYHGLELALRHAGQVDMQRITARLQATGMEIPCISSGQVFAADRLYFTHPDPAVREAAVDRISDMVHLAAQFQAKVNTGRVRGFVHDGESNATAASRYLECLHRCADVAEPLGVELIIEPVNRYEINFINSCAEGVEIIERARRACLKLMPDLFHMNIEDSNFRDALVSARHHISYVHVADSNRLAPGWGHMPFDEIFQILADISYDGYITAEILPKPDPDSAAVQAARFLLPRLQPLVVETR